MLSVQAADLGMVANGAKSDLDQALQELSDLRKRIESERLPLAQKLRELEQQTIDRRLELEKAQRSQENQLVELNALKADVKRRAEEAKFIEALLTEHLRGFETRIHISEVQRYRDAIDSAKAAAAGELTPAERLDRQAALLEVSLERIEGAISGETFEGRALTPQGRLEQGRFAMLGPIALFASSRSDATGLAQLQLGSAEPTVIELPPEFSRDVRAIATTGSGNLPLDTTLGTAQKLRDTEDGIIEHMAKGGPVMIPIVLLGLGSVLIFLARWLVVGRIRVATPADLQVILGALNRGDREKANALASNIKGPVGEMLAKAIEHCRERKEYVEEVMYEKMIETRPKLEKLLPFIALAAAAAPLLGLLGTVTGMINTFNMITVFGTGDPKTLAGGISEALITTEFGLIVAIPSLLLHAILSRKVKGVLGSMEQTTVAFINGLPAHSDETLFLQKQA